MSGQAESRKKSECVRGASLRIGTPKEKLRLAIRKSQGRLIDETGNKFGRLTVISYVGSGKDVRNGIDGGAAWLCRCDCGKEVVTFGTKLRKGIIKSCGNHWELASGEASFNAKISVMKFSARKRGFDWKLNKDQVRHLLTGNCAYCGSEPSMLSRGRTCKDPFVCNGIDRIDSKLGYIAGNVVSCCPTCNKSKMTQSVEEFISWFKKIAQHNGWECDIETIKFRDLEAMA